jgi:hypothetical protein
MVAPVRKRDRACPAQAQQTASAFKHFRPINRNWQPPTAALMQHPRAKLRRKNVQKQNSSKCARNVQQQTTGDSAYSSLTSAALRRSKRRLAADVRLSAVCVR